MALSYHRFRSHVVATLLVGLVAGVTNADSMDPLAQFGLQLCVGSNCAVGPHGLFVNPGDGTVFDLPAATSFEPATGHFAGMGLFMDAIAMESAGVMGFSGNVAADIALGGMVFDYGEPTQFAFLARAPRLPADAGRLHVSGDMSASCTDMNADQRCGAAVGSLAPTLLNLMIADVVVAGAALGADSIVRAPLGSASVAAVSGATDVDCSTLAAGCTHMTTLLTFVGSGGGDLITFNARFLLAPVTVNAPHGWLLAMCALLAALRSGGRNFRQQASPA